MRNFNLSEKRRKRKTAAAAQRTFALGRVVDAYASVPMTIVLSTCCVAWELPSSYPPNRS